MVGFILTATVGFVLLLVFLIFDGILDAVHVDFTGSGVFSGASLGGFLTGVGCGGVIGTAQGWGFFSSMVLGIFLGLSIAAVAVILYRLLRKAEASQEDFSLDRLVGTTGIVTAGSHPGARGLVQVTYLGSPRTVSFSSDTPLAAGDPVLVTEVLGQDAVFVIPSQPTYGRTLE
jgi:membrane protein implicated in regulation of membrane protease activity